MGKALKLLTSPSKKLPHPLTYTVYSSSGPFRMLL